VAQYTANYNADVASYRQTVLTAFQQVEDYIATLRVVSEQINPRRYGVEGGPNLPGSCHDQIPDRTRSLPERDLCADHAVEQSADPGVTASGGVTGYQQLRCKRSKVLRRAAGCSSFSAPVSVTRGDTLNSGRQNARCLEQRLCFVQLQKAPTRGDHGSRQVIAFLPDEGMSAEDLQRSVRDLEKIGLRVRVISPEWQGLSPGDYCALATATALFPPEKMDAGARRIIQIMEAAGKPVICIPGVAARDRGAEESPSPFSMKRLLADSWHNWNAIDAPRLGRTSSA